MKSEPTMAEKLAELHNQKLLRHPQPKTGEPQTLHSTALRDLGLEKSNVGIRSATVTGTNPTSDYPTLPPNSPWSSAYWPAHSAPEAPLGIDVNFVEPVVAPEIVSLSALANPTEEISVVASPPSVGPATGTAQATEDVPVAPIPKTPKITIRRLKA
jgi:hypothetical protein